MEYKVARNLAIREEIRRAIRDAGLKQKAVAELIGDREDTFSKRLAMKQGYEMLDASDLLTILDASNLSLAEFGRRLETRTQAILRGEIPERSARRRKRPPAGTDAPSA